jgi:hypothetical protein
MTPDVVRKGTTIRLCSGYAAVFFKHPRITPPIWDGARSPICPSRIVMDADEQLGQPVVSNGLPLTKIHYAAFDAQQRRVGRIKKALIQNEINVLPVNSFKIY